MKTLRDVEEVIITGKQLAEHRDICRKEGALMQTEKIKKIIIKEWEKHKNNYYRNEMWFECQETEFQSSNYVLGAQIVYYDSIKKKQITTILDTKEKIAKQKEKDKILYGSCPICDRFRKILKELEGVEK